MNKRIIEAFNKKDIKLDLDQANLFALYMELLIEENKKYNLTAITEPNDIIEKHFVDSCLPYMDISKDATIIDIGAGAGFPGVPLAIIRQDCKFVLVDSLRKRTDFLNMLITKLNLKNCTIVWSRSEDLAQNKDYREKFDYCIARAVAQMNTLTEYCLPFVKVGGKMLAYKSKEVENEVNNALNAIKQLGGELEGIKKVKLNDLDRSFVFINKKHGTPLKYPRKQNKPKTNPL